MQGALMKKILVLSVMMNFVVVSGSEHEKNSSIKQHDIIMKGVSYQINLKADSSDGSSEENDSDQGERSNLPCRRKKWVGERKAARIQRRKGQLKILERDIITELETETSLDSSERWGLYALLSTVQQKQLNNEYAESINSRHNWTQKLTSVYAEVESTLLPTSQQRRLRKKYSFKQGAPINKQAAQTVRQPHQQQVSCTIS